MGSQRVRHNWVTNFHFQGKWIRRRMKKCRREQNTHWAHWLQTILMAAVHPSCPLSSHRPSRWALLSLYRSKSGKARIWPGLSDSKGSQVAHWERICLPLQEMQETWVWSQGWESPDRGNGKPLQRSCQENPMDRGAWWAIICGVTKSRTEQLSAHTFWLQSLCFSYWVIIFTQ